MLLFALSYPVKRSSFLSLQTILMVRARSPPYPPPDHLLVHRRRLGEPTAKAPIQIPPPPSWKAPSTSKASPTAKAPVQIPPPVASVKVQTEACSETTSAADVSNQNTAFANHRNDAADSASIPLPTPSAEVPSPTTSAEVPSPTTSAESPSTPTSFPVDLRDEGALDDAASFPHDADMTK